jgi:DNA-binding NarL/FixJ family response regulator
MRIMIADSHPEVRAALRLLLEEDSATWIVTAEASNAIELVNKARSANPRIILLDWDLPGLRAARYMDHQRVDKVIVALKAIAPKAGIMVLSTSGEEAKNALLAGADAFLCKSEPPQQLLAGIKELEQRLPLEQTATWSSLPHLPIEPSQ